MAAAAAPAPEAAAELAALLRVTDAESWHPGALAAGGGAGASVGVGVSTRSSTHFSSSDTRRSDLAGLSTGLFASADFSAGLSSGLSADFSARLSVGFSASESAARAAALGAHAEAVGSYARGVIAVAIRAKAVCRLSAAQAARRLAQRVRLPSVAARKRVGRTSPTQDADDYNWENKASKGTSPVYPKRGVTAVVRNTALGAMVEQDAERAAKYSLQLIEPWELNKPWPPPPIRYRPPQVFEAFRVPVPSGHMDDNSEGADFEEEPAAPRHEFIAGYFRTFSGNLAKAWPSDVEAPSSEVCADRDRAAIGQGPAQLATA